MVRAKAGDLYACEVCGMAVTIEEACACDACGLVCCDVPMVKKAGGAGKAKKKAAPARAKRTPKAARS
ncbi:MAG: hypothetical protein A4E67_01005 [Syntrophaceae bacterium PtaB.Bin038]|nr:MAG: hypothetical protein A4E67_01005 [Syntrophaceae bacterium PtaB.Bin038]